MKAITIGKAWRCLFGKLLLAVLLPVLGRAQQCNGDALIRAGSTDIEFSGNAALDDAGNLYSTGYFVGNTSFGGTTLTSGSLQFGVYLVCHDASRQVRYARTLMSSWSSFFVPPRIIKSGNYLYILARNGGDSIYVQGYYQRDRYTRSYVLIQADLNGTILWHRVLSYADGFASTVGFALTADDVGNAYIGGTFADTLNVGGTSIGATGAYSPMAFIAKFNSVGNMQWVRSSTVANPDYVYLRSLSLTTTGLVVGAGLYHKEVAFGVHSAGATNTAPNADAPYAVAFDTAGNFAWLNAATETAASASLPMASAPDGAGNTYVTGFVTDTVDFGGGIKVFGQENMFVAKYGPGGSVLWAKAKSGHVGTDLETGTAIHVTPRGRVVVAGTFTDSTYFGAVKYTSAGAQDFFLASYDNAGNLQHATTYGSPGNDEADFVCSLPNDSLVVGGYFVGPTFTINGHVVTRSGSTGTDLFWYDQCTVPLSTTGPTAEAAIVVYPNPAADYLNIAFPEAVVGEAQVKVYDAVGRLTAVMPIRAGATSAVFPTREWAYGTYTIVLVLNGCSYRQLLTHL